MWLQEPYAVNGSVQIRVNVTGSTPCLVLHALGMNITHAALEHPHTHGGLSEPLQETLQ